MKVLEEPKNLLRLHFFVPYKEGKKIEKTVNSIEVTTVDVVVFWLSST